MLAVHILPFFANGGEGFLEQVLGVWSLFAFQALVLFGDYCKLRGSIRLEAEGFNKAGTYFFTEIGVDS